MTGKLNALKQSKVMIWIILSIFVVGLMTLESMMLYHGYTRHAPGTADFFARWYGARELLLQGRNPYDREIELEAQKGIFGRHTNPDEDQVNFAYPLYTIYLFWPLTYLPYAWAQAIWMVVLQFALLGLIIVLFDLLNWRLQPWLLVATLLWGLYFYPGTRTVMLGQFSALVALFLMLSLWGLKQGHDQFAGAVLPLTTIKPQMVFLVIPLLLLWAGRQGRRAFIIAFTISLSSLCLSSLFFVPDWPLRFLNNLRAYSGYVGFGSPLENMLAYFAPALMSIFHPLLTLLLGGLMLWQWKQVLFKKPEDLLWAVNITLLISNLIAFRSATANHVILYCTLMLLFKRWAGTQYTWSVLVWQLLSGLGLWILFLNTIDTTRGNNFEAVFMHGFLPTLLILYILVDWQALKMRLPKMIREM